MKNKSPLSTLSPRERRLIQNLQNPQFKTLQDAFIAAGYAKSTARKAPGRLLGGVRIRETITDIMERKGLTDERLMDITEEGLKATKVIAATIIRGKPDSIADKRDGMKDADSVSKDFVDVDDYATRHKYLETSLKLKGYLITSKVGLEDSKDGLQKLIEAIEAGPVKNGD